MSNQDFEPARKKRSPLKYLVFIILAALIIAGCYWAAKQFIAKGEVEIPLPKEVAQAVNDNLGLEDGKLGPVRISPTDSFGAGPGTTAPQPAPQPSTPNDGRPEAAGLIVAPELSAPALVASHASRGPTRKKIYSGSDAVITVNFATDLAVYLAKSYWPKGTHLAAVNGPASSASLNSAGQRYGIELIGFTSTRPQEQRDYLRDRSLVLKYAYTPSMVKALTQLYCDRFVDRLAEEGLKQVRKKGGRDAPLTRAEVGEMLSFYADYARSVGAALSAYNAQVDAAHLVSRYTVAQEDTYQATVAFNEAKFQLENALAEEKANTLRDAEKTMKAAEQEYRRAMIEEERTKEAVLAFMRKGSLRQLADQELLYVAAWGVRRGYNAAATNEAAAESAEFIGQLLDEKAREFE